jgi:hypothetical protein
MFYVTGIPTEGIGIPSGDGCQPVSPLRCMLIVSRQNRFHPKKSNCAKEITRVLAVSRVTRRAFFSETSGQTDSDAKPAYIAMQNIKTAFNI